MKKSIIIILALLLVLSIYKSRSSNENQKISSLEILAFGDSITYGYNLKKDESYPSILAKLLDSNVTNAGVNGEITQDGLVRLEKILSQKRFDILILCEGGNDILRNLNTDSTKENLNKMVKLAKERGIFVVLVGVPNLGMFGLSDHEIFKEVAKENGVLLADTILADILSSAKLKIDQIHPNAKGYELLAKQLSEIIKKNYKI